MANKTFCDRCNLEIDYGSKLRIEFRDENKIIWKDYHIDCFNYEFSTDIRKLTKRQEGE